MRSLLTLMLLVAAMLPALGQAQTINICDRTPQVRDYLLQSFRGERGGGGGGGYSELCRR